jgi:asparagine synthase (glutamine-hydrolysing)
MSGIAGIVRFDGGGVCPDEIEAMLASMRRRGPDAKRGWASEGAALGHVLLTTTNEAACEVQPWVDRESGCVVVSDSRLDNRPELLRALGRSATNPDGVGDGELLLAAWQKWREGCAERLLGDFAFAIWDSLHRTLFCARDVMGVRPFYYSYSAARRFVLASEPGAVLRQPISADLNEGRIADAIVSELEGIDKTSTFFQSVTRLPPATYAILRDGQLHIREYWHPLRREPATLSQNDDAWIDELRATLQESVRCRLRSVGRVGSMLSGGLDSAAVVALADELLRVTKGEHLLTF